MPVVHQALSSPTTPAKLGAPTTLLRATIAFRTRANAELPPRTFSATTPLPFANSSQSSRVTYTLTMAFATTLAKLNPDMTFCYVSGASTDSSEKGKMMWARVKGKTENDLTKLPFRQVYNFRPAFMTPTPGLKNVNSYYKYVAWLVPLLRLILPNSISTLKVVGLAMINVTLRGYEKQVLEVVDIKKIAELSS